MHPVRLIEDKRDGRTHSRGEIEFLVDGFVRGDVADYQMAAWLMAVCFWGLDAEETVALTEAMRDSGATLLWPPGGAPVVDKHSTGGVGDKSSLILAPLLATLGCKVPMVSGRGLGLTGGTLDKLESVPGLRTDLSVGRLQDIVDRIGVAMGGQTEDFCPADRRMYALRDVTGTVPSIPLITASILSKKAAESLDVLVLDVKFGSGAFMRTEADARELGASLLAVGRGLDMRIDALLTDMNRPTGRAVGNAVEIREAVRLLRGDRAGIEDLAELVTALASAALVAAGRFPGGTAAADAIDAALDDGSAHETWRRMVQAQGGDPDADLPTAAAHEVVADRSGFVAATDSERLARVVTDLGGGRRKASDAIDPAVGVVLRAVVGDRVEQGQPLAAVHAAADAPLAAVAAAFEIVDEAVPRPPLILDRL